MWPLVSTVTQEREEDDPPGIYVVTRETHCGGECSPEIGLDFRSM
jgi:hypothetical protein